MLRGSVRPSARRPRVCFAAAGLTNQAARICSPPYSDIQIQTRKSGLADASSAKPSRKGRRARVNTHVPTIGEDNAPANHQGIVDHIKRLAQNSCRKALRLCNYRAAVPAACRGFTELFRNSHDFGRLSRVSTDAASDPRRPKFRSPITENPRPGSINPCGFTAKDRLGRLITEAAEV